MDCETFMPTTTLLFWGLPFAAVYWIRRRRQTPGASISLGRIVLVLWFATFPVVILLLFSGGSRLEGNYGDAICWPALATIGVLLAAYGLLYRSLKASPGAN